MSWGVATRDSRLNVDEAGNHSHSPTYPPDFTSLIGICSCPGRVI